MTEHLPETGPLSLDQAVSLLDLPRKEAPEAEAAETEAPAAQTEQPDSLAEPMAKEPFGADTQTEGSKEGEPQEQEVDGDEPEQPALEPPKFWDAEAKKRFGALPRDVQEIILRKEDERNAATARALQETAEKRKAAETTTSQLSVLKSRLDQIVPQAEQAIQDRWANVDWNAVVDRYGADQALKLKNMMEAERQQLAELRAAKQKADHAAQAQFRNDRAERFKTVIPDLADAKLGPQRQKELVEFIGEAGIDPNWAIHSASAEMLAIAYDAMQWRKGKSAAQTLVNAKPAKPAPQRQVPVKPTGTSQPRSTNQTRIDQLSRKRELTIDEAVELANLKGHAA